MYKEKRKLFTYLYTYVLHAGQLMYD